MSSLEMRNEFEYANLKEDNLIVSEELTDLNNNRNHQITLLSNSIIDLTLTICNPPMQMPRVRIRSPKQTTN